MYRMLKITCLQLPRERRGGDEDRGRASSSSDAATVRTAGGGTGGDGQLQHGASWRERILVRCWNHLTQPHLQNQEGGPHQNPARVRAPCTLHMVLSILTHCIGLSLNSLFHRSVTEMSLFTTSVVDRPRSCPLSEVYSQVLEVYIFYLHDALNNFT